VGREYTSLGSVSRGQVEVEHSGSARAVIFDKFLINNAPRRRVYQALAFLHKEPLCNSFVDHYDSNRWWLRNTVVQVFDYWVQLRDLILEHLFAHGITNTISVDNKVGGLASLLHFKRINSSPNQRHHLILHNFLSLLLHYIVREVLTHMLISTSCKPYYWFTPRMTHINPNEHCFHGVQYCGKLHGK